MFNAVNFRGFARRNVDSDWAVDASYRRAGYRSDGRGCGRKAGPRMSDSYERSFRFYDNREKYLLFVSTCSEKQEIARRIAMDIRGLQPVAPALRVFDAGMGDATVLTRLMRDLHFRYPTVPFLIVGKEISQEDVRISLEKMADRFYEHPLTVLVLTNMLYTEAPWLYPRSEAMQARLNWTEVRLEGSTAFEFDKQIQDLEKHVQDWWKTTPSPRTGNPVYVTPSVLVMYRRDHEWPLGSVIPQKGATHHEYDVVVAAQPFRARLSARVKVRNVLAPLARCLAPGGCMVVIQSTGKDPGMEIIRGVWPGENPFQTPRQTLLRELSSQLGDTYTELRYLTYPDSRAQFYYELRLPPSELETSISTSTVLAAWNAATYVAQIDDERLRPAMSRGDYIDITSQVLEKYKGLWFMDESFNVARAA